jgi:hypothetical protein
MAGRKCSICTHPKRNEIDKSLAADGAILRAISQQFHVSKDSLRRHMDNGHIAEKIAKATHLQEIHEADSLLTQMQRVKDETWVIHKESRERVKKVKDGTEPNPDNDLALKALARLEKQIEIESKILGVNPDPPQNPVNVNLNISEEVKKLVGILPAVKL